MRRTRLVIDGLGTPVLEAGPADAREAAVFVHGNPGASDDFLELVEAAGRHGRAIAMDMPGFGRADKPDDWPATVEAYGDHLGALVDHLGLDRVHVVLHDFGGPWGLSWLADNPDRAASLLLVNIVSMPDHQWHSLARLWRTPVVGGAAMARVPRSLFHTMLREGNPTPIPGEHVDRMFAHFDAATRRTVLRLYRDTDPAKLDALADRLRGLDLPVLVVWGEADPYITMRQAQRLQDVFPSARFVRIPDAGHWPFLSRPDVTNPVIVDWLRGHLAPSGR